MKKGGHEALARQVRGFMLQVELQKAMMAGGGVLKGPVTEAVAFLQEAPPQAADITLADTARLAAEMIDDRQLASKTYVALA